MSGRQQNQCEAKFRASVRFAVCFVLAVAYVVMDGRPSLGQEPSAKSFPAEDLEFFEKEVRPLLAKRCFECHGPNVSEPEGDLQMVSHAAFVVGGESGPAINLENVSESILVQAINYSGLYEMPPDSKLPESEIAILTKWVERGAPWSATELTATIGPKKFDLEKRRLDHWCWQPITKPAIPAVSDKSWPRHDLDAFILHELERNKLTPASEADSRTLVRRLYFDLSGLPPSPEDVEQFLTDKSPDAYERLVDRLLASPRFGEHWARRWMDLVRYAETCGHEFDYPLPHAYQYRDYLIRAFNADVPYDQFVREHVAGDLLPQPRLHPTDQYNESIIATGSWFLGEATHGPVDVRGDEAGRIDNQIDVFGKTFLGLTVACARCHDHMFDAIATRDYYGLVGFMQSSRRQLALLDPGRKIESAIPALIDRQEKLDQRLAEIRSSVAEQDVENSAKYLAVAIGFWDAQGPLAAPQSLKIQGEDFAAAKPSGGRIEAQELSPHDDVRWEGNKQLWWLDAKTGDRLTLELSIAAEGQYELIADFTSASDYGIVRLSIDDQVIAESLDLYSADLGKTGPQALANLALKSGHHRFDIEIIGSNKAAAPKFMFGLDFIELRARADELSKDQRDVVKILANEQKLDSELLDRWVRAFRDVKLADAIHPLNVVQRLMKEKAFSNSDSSRTVMAEVQRQRDEANRALNESPAFEDFDDPNIRGWFRTGWGFGRGVESAWSFDDSQTLGQVVGRAGTVSSGRLGTPLYGVLRSPTFSLDHKFIHYRLAGRETEVRLIIDGFTLDNYNSLLFNGVTLKVDSPDRFIWLAQGQDVSNYLGHRAHIEIIDHSGGSVVVDEIRFSDHATLADPPSDFADELLGAMQKSPETERIPGFSAHLINRIRESIVDDQPNADSEALLDWLIRWDLIDSDSFRTNAAELNRQSSDRQQWLRDNRIPAPIFAQALADGTGENEFVFIRGNHKTPGPEAPRRMIDAIPTRTNFELTPQTGSGRLQLADAVACAENPLTSRVIANRLWHHLFGQGLVPSVDNFGVLGERPTHPELLDHLATSMVEQSWSIKQAIRKLLTSSTYRMSSRIDAAAEQADPENRLLHRMAVRRLSSEAIRDSILQVSGQLDTAMYGPSVPIYLTPFMQGRGRPGESGPLDGNRRRSVYIEVRRNFLSPMMLAFDTPSPFNAVGRRTVSNVPSQSLMLLNHPLVLQQSELWAQRLLRSETSGDGRLNRLFTEAYARPMQAAEAKIALQFLASQRRQLEESGTSSEQSELMAWRDLCHVLINAKEFFYVN